MRALPRVSFLIALAAACTAALPARAEWIASQRVRRSAEGAAARESLLRTWYGPDRMREETTGGNGYLLRLDLQRAWAIDHASRSCREFPALPHADRSTLLGFGTPPPVVRETGEARTIGIWPCRRWRVSRKVPRGNAAAPALLESDIWTTDAIPASAFLAERTAYAAGSRALLEELRKVRGFPVLQVERTTFLGKTEERVIELLAIAEQTPPPGTWDLPAGYAGGNR